MKAHFLIILAALATSCSSTLYTSSGYAADDLYATHDPAAVAARRQAIAEQERAEAEARIAQARARQAEADAYLAELTAARSEQAEQQPAATQQGTGKYARLLSEFDAPQYQAPETYYAMGYNAGAYRYYTAYNPAYWDVQVIGPHSVVIEPRYTFSFWGGWSTPSYFYGSSWYYRPALTPGYWRWNWGWDYDYYYGRPYYWNDPWDWGYDYWYGPGYGHRHDYYRPSRPANTVNRGDYARPSTRPAAPGTYTNRGQGSYNDYNNRPGTTNRGEFSRPVGSGSSQPSGTYNCPSTAPNINTNPNTGSGNRGTLTRPVDDRPSGFQQPSRGNSGSSNSGYSSGNRSSSNNNYSRPVSTPSQSSSSSNRGSYSSGGRGSFSSGSSGSSSRGSSGGGGYSSGGRTGRR